MNNEELAKKLVASKHWRWMPGMLTLEEVVPPAITLGWDPARVISADDGDVPRVITVCERVRDIHDTALPDLDDPATKGCLLALVREVWGDPGISVVGVDLKTRDRLAWRLAIGGRTNTARRQYRTEVQVLVAALLAAL